MVFLILMFFSGNGIKNGQIMTSSFEEAYTQKLALERSSEIYLLIDSYRKIGERRVGKECTLFPYTTLFRSYDRSKAHV